MAIAVAFRLAIALSPVAYRVVVSTKESTAEDTANALGRLWTRLFDPEVTADELNAEGASVEGPSVYVTDFAGTFELRKLAWRLSRAPTGGTIEDIAVCTFHFIKASGGTPGTYVDGTDLPAVETALGTYWGAIKAQYPTWIHSDQFRWYKDGPAFYELGSGGSYVPIATGNPAIRVTEVDVAGTGSGACLPPQAATTVTEITSSRIHWGRWYLPAPTAGNADTNGRYLAASLATSLGAAVTFYNSCRTASMVPVVWSIQKPVRTKKNGGELPAAAAKAYEVTSLQFDDLFDVIRSRRYGAPTVRTRTALT